MFYEIETLIDEDILYDCFNKDVERKINSKNVKLISSSEKFKGEKVCYNYALKKANIQSCYDAYEYLEEYYQEIDISKAQKGDILSYHELYVDEDENINNEIPNYDNVLHFAIIEKTDKTINGTYIKSKWGTDGVFLSTIQEVPNMYGNAIQIWRKKGVKNVDKRIH